MASLEAAHNSHKASVTEEVAKIVDSKMSEQFAEFTKLTREFAAMSHHQHQELSRKVEGHDGRLQELEAANTRAWDEIERLKKHMAVIEKEEFTQEDVKSESWDREPDPRVVVVGTAHLVGKNELFAQLREHAACADIRPEVLRLEGSMDGLARNVVLHFDGDSPPAGWAAKRAKKYMLALKRPNGDYEEYNVTSPTGEKSKLYFNKDENPQNKYVKRISKKFKHVISQAFPGRQVHLANATATVTVDWIPVARLSMDRGPTHTSGPMA